MYWPNTHTHTHTHTHTQRERKRASCTDCNDSANCCWFGRVNQPAADNLEVEEEEEEEEEHEAQ
jgi:hypothetical protein